LRKRKENVYEKKEKAKNKRVVKRKNIICTKNKRVVKRKNIKENFILKN